MKTCAVSVATGNASRYFRKLCQHWSHLFQVEFNERRGTIHLQDAICILEWWPANLGVRLEMQEVVEERRLRQLVEEHLHRVVVHEQLTFAWDPVLD